MNGVRVAAEFAQAEVNSGIKRRFELPFRKPARSLSVDHILLGAPPIACA